MFFSNSLFGGELFRTTGGTFDIDIIVFTDTCKDNVAKEISAILKEEITIEDLDVRAVTFYRYGQPIALWFDINKMDCKIINHELFHVVACVLQWAGLSLSDETEEAYAYEMQYLTEVFYKHLKPK